MLACTVGAASLLAYLLLRGRADDGPALKDERFKGDEFFSAVLDGKSVDQLATHSGTEQGCRWSQTDDEVEVLVTLASGVRGKDCQCKVLPDKLSISVPGGSGTPTAAVQGRLFRRVKADEADWSIGKPPARAARRRRPFPPTDSRVCRVAQRMLMASAFSSSR